MEPDRLVVGRIVKAHGIRGEVGVDVLSDAPERFAPGSRVGAGDPPRRLTVQSVRDHQGRLLVKFAEVPDRTAAEAIRGLVLSIDAAEARPLPEGSWYPHQLEDLDVVDEQGARLGRWVRAEESPAHDVWVVDVDGREVLIPAIADLIVGVELDARRIVVRPMPGLFD